MSNYGSKIQSTYQTQSAAVYGIATASAMAAMVPIPGLDIALDLASLVVFANTCVTQFGLSEEELDRACQNRTKKAIAKRVYKYQTRAGIIALVKKFAVQKAAGSVVQLLGKQSLGVWHSTAHRAP